MLIKGVITVVLVLLFLGSVYASPNCNRKDQIKIKMMQFDDINKLFIDSKTNGYVYLTKGIRARALGYNLKPFEFYTLISVDLAIRNGNNESLYVECINKKQATRNGNLKINQFEYDYSCYLSDNSYQVLMIVKSSDVDCYNNRFAGFNSRDYLYATTII